MYRVSSRHSGRASPSRSKRSSSRGSRSSRSRGSTSRSKRSRSRSRRRSPSPRDRRRRSRSPRRSSRRRSPSPRPTTRRHSLCRRSHSPGWQSPSQDSECSVDYNLRATVGSDCYGIETPERKKLSDRLGSPVDSLSDVYRCFSHPRSLERHPFCEDNPFSPLDMKQDEGYHSKDVFVYKSDCPIKYNHLQDQPRKTDWDGELLRKSSYSSEDGRQEPKHFNCDEVDRLLDRSIDPKDFLPGTQKYCKQSFSRSPSPTYLDEDFHKLELVRRKREEMERNRNLNRELPGNSYIFPESTKPVQPSEPQYLYRPKEAPAIPKKSILKKHVEDPSVQPCSTDSFSSDMDSFLKRFNKNAVAELAANKESQRSLCDWKLYSDQQQNSSPFEQNSRSFLIQTDHHESAFEPADRQADFLLPHERASQDGSGFSCVLGMMADSTSIQEKRRHSFPDETEDEQKFLYGDENDSHIHSPYAQKLTLANGKETVKQKVSSSPPPSPPVKPGTSEEACPEYEKIQDLFKTIGLDIEVAEIGKLAARTQERLHGKKTSYSPDRHLVASHEPGSRKRHRSRSDTHSPESSRKYSLSPPGSFPPSEDMSSVLNSDCNKSQTVGQDNPFGTLDQSVLPVPIIPSAPPCLPNLSPSPNALSWYKVPHFPPFSATPLPQSYPPPTMPPPGYFAYGPNMAYAASGWPMFAQQAALSGVSTFLTPRMPTDCPQTNPSVTEAVSISKGPPVTKRNESVLVQIPIAAPNSKVPPGLSPRALKGAKERVIETVSTGKGPPFTTRNESVLVQIPTAAPNSKLLPELSPCALKDAKERVIETVSTGKGPPVTKRNESVLVQIPIAAPNSKLLPELSPHALKGAKERIPVSFSASQRQKLLEEREKLKGEEEAVQKQLLYLKTELNRLSIVQEMMLQRKSKKKDPLLVEVSRQRENVVKEVAELEIKASAVEKKKSELDTVARILRINIVEKSQKLSLENKESSEKCMPEDAKNEERTPNPIKS